jgi:PAS domain S-box-containing protein
MEKQPAQVNQTENVAASDPSADPNVRHYEILVDLTSQMLATQNLDERISLALDTITTSLGYPRAAIALIDEPGAVLRMKMAVGFRDNAEVERVEMPLDTAAIGVSVIYDGRPVRITSDGTEYSPFMRNLAGNEDMLAFPLFGAQPIPDKFEGEYARKRPGEERYWEPELTCLGVLYIGARRETTEQLPLSTLQRFADQIGIIVASALQSERLAASVKTYQRERQWVESIMQSVADPIVLTNLDNEILLQNRRAEELFSGSEEGSEGKRRALKMNDFLFSAYLSGRAVSSVDPLVRELTLVDPIEGTDVHFEVISTPALNEEDQRIGVVSVFRDVTDLRKTNDELARNYIRLRQAEAEARRERDRLNRIIENVGHPVVVTDADGNFILFNRRAGALFQVEQVPTTPANRVVTSEPDPVSSRTLAAVRANSVKLTSFISGLASETRSGRQAEIELVDPESGLVVPMELTSVEVLDAKGQVTAVVSVLHDLSQMRELERSRLEQKLFESEKLAAVGTLAATIAHEVNNPLEAIKNSLHLLQSTKDDESASRFLSIAARETERVSHIVRQMLGFARRSGSVEWVNVNELIRETLTLVERKLQHSGIRIVEELDSKLPSVHCYSDQLRQVLLNLILNAQQSIEGGGTIAIRTMLHEQNSVIVQIKDSGCGIRDEDRNRIFEPFFSMRKDGTGLGLWVTQNIVRQHGGRIEVSSTDEMGTTLSIILPIDSPTLAAQQG